MKTILISAATILTLILAVRPAKAADAYDALRQLGRQAGVDAAPIADQMKTIRALSVTEADEVRQVARGADVFESCSALEARSFAPWTPKQAALLVQTCLNHAYAAGGRYTVVAQAARFAVSVCPDAKPGTMSCRALVEVDGIKITVAGAIMAGDSVLEDLNASLKNRGGKLLGFSAIVDNKAEIKL